MLPQVSTGSEKVLNSSEKMTDAEQPKPAEDCLFKGKRLYCKKKIFGEGVFLFDGYWKENAGAIKERRKTKAPFLLKEVAIRRIKNEDCLDEWKDVADKLVHLNHNNILRVFGYEEDVGNGWRYFALEPYNATLYEYCNYEYKGPMPNESQVLYQITNGMCYLHGKGIVHGDLNPLNVVIAAQSRPVRMKFSDFGLSKFSYSEQLSLNIKGEIPFKMELCLRKYWYWELSDETDSLKGIKDATGDVVAAACILFYYLKRGKHIFGKDFESILINLEKNNPVNLPKLDKNHFAYEPIKNMIIPQGKGFSWLHIANEKFKEALSLQVDASKLLGSGAYGYVYEGKFNGDPVAVKQMTTTTAQKEIIQREMNSHIELNHVNVVKLFDVADSADNRFTQLVLELCAGTLADYCEKKYSGPKLPPDELVLYQIANGLDYIHSRNLVHRDIKPENILISMTTPIQMKVSDLSFVKKTRQDIFSQSKIRGTLLWMDPERLKFLNDTENPENKSADLPDGTIKSDTFSSGCVFFYFLTRGTHPFGKNQATTPANIVQNNPVEFDSYKQSLAADDVNGRIIAGLIEKMIQFEEEERIGLPEVLKQLATLLYAMDKSKCQLRLVEARFDGKYSIRSHPTEPILACAREKELIFRSAENWSIPFSNWREKVTCLPILDVESTLLLEWNMNGTQLAVGAAGSVVVWSYPECKILFQKKLSEYVNVIEWNPTRPNLFAAVNWGGDKVFLWDSSIGDVITNIDCQNVSAVKWISKNRIAVSSFDGKIRIFEMDDNNLTTTRLKEFAHRIGCYYLAWNERIQYLASGSDYQINIWSMDHDIPVYSLGLENVWGPTIAWRLCTGDGEEEGGIETARKSAKNFTFAYVSENGVFIWNPLESEQPRRLYEERDMGVVAFTSNGRFLAAGGNEKLIIWSAENWIQLQIHKFNYWGFGIQNLSFFTTKSTNLYENKFFDNYGEGSSVIYEYAFEESNISDSASEISTESDDNGYGYDDEEDVDAESEDVSPPKRLKELFL